MIYNACARFFLLLLFYFFFEGNDSIFRWETCRLNRVLLPLCDFECASLHDAGSGESRPDKKEKRAGLLRPRMRHAPGRSCATCIPFRGIFHAGQVVASILKKSAQKKIEKKNRITTRKRDNKNRKLIGLRPLFGAPSN